MWQKMLQVGSGGSDVPIKNFATGTIQRNPSTSAKATLGFKPTILIGLDASNKIMFYYNKNINETQYILAYNNSAPSFTNFYKSYLYSLEDDGFTIEQGSSVVAFNYIAFEL